MNGKGQLKPSFGWRATHVMSLRGFQLFHLRSKRRRRLLLLPLFSLTFYTVTSFDRGWGREGEKKKGCQWAPDNLVQAPAEQSFLSRKDKAMPLQLTHCFLDFFLDVLCNKTTFPSAWYISFLSEYVTCTRQKGGFHMTAGFGYSRLHGWSLPYFSTELL